MSEKQKLPYPEMVVGKCSCGRARCRNLDIKKPFIGQAGPLYPDAALRIQSCWNACRHWEDPEKTLRKMNAMVRRLLTLRASGVGNTSQEQDRILGKLHDILNPEGDRHAKGG